MSDTPWDAVLMAVLLAAVAGGAWRWQQTVRGRYHLTPPADSWEQAQDQFPMPVPFGAAGADPFGIGRPGESLQEVVKANPFSPQRRAVPPPSALGAAAGGAVPPPANMLERLERTIEARKTSPPPGSYVAGLLAAGEAEICRKIGEEATEVITATLGGEGDRRVIEEAADLWFHTLVLLGARGIPFREVVEELARRHARRAAPGG